jgi:hypothetical protein
MPHTFSLENTLGAGQRLRSNLDTAAQNREFNSLRQAGERQRQDIQQRTFDANQQQANTEKLLNGVRIARSNPNLLPKVGQELVSAGILNPDELPGLLQRAQEDPEGFSQRLGDFESQLMFALGESPTKGVTAPSAVREFEAFEKLGNPNNPDVLSPAQKRFIQVKRASGQIIDIGGVPNLVDKETGEQTPLSTPDVEVSAAATQAGAITSAQQEAQIAALPQKTQQQALIDLPNVEAATNEGIALIDSVLDDPGLPAVIGFLQGRTRGLTGKQRGLVKKIEQIQGKVFLDAFERLKGGGQITELEGKAATDAQARINDRTVDEAAFIDALLELRETMDNGLTRARTQAGQEAPTDDTGTTQVGRFTVEPVN